MGEKIKPDEARKLNVQKMFALVSKRYGLGKIDFASFENEVRKLINKKTQMRIPESQRFNFGVVLLTFLVRVKDVFIDGKGYADMEKLLGIRKGLSKKK